jgi:ribonuclease P protein component
MTALPRSHRLTRARDFDAMRRVGVRVRVPQRLPDLDVRSAPTSASHARVGLIVPRHKHSAVDRNRLKRRLRELVRTRLLPALPPVDLVLKANASAYDAGFERLAEQIGRLAAALEARA